jgi:hypothetical protein
LEKGDQKTALAPAHAVNSKLIKCNQVGGFFAELAKHVNYRQDRYREIITDLPQTYTR